MDGDLVSNGGSCPARTVHDDTVSPWPVMCTVAAMLKTLFKINVGGLRTGIHINDDVPIFPIFADQCLGQFIDQIVSNLIEGSRRSSGICYGAPKDENGVGMSNLQYQLT